MFDTVGRVQRSPRRLVAMALSLVFNAGTLAALVAAGAREVEERVEIEARLDWPPVQVSLAPAPAPGPPSPSPAKPGPRRPVPKAAPAPSLSPAPAPPVHAALSPVPPAPVAPEGGGDSVGDGGPGGGGPPGGDGEGLGGDGSGGGDGLRVVHWSEVRVKTPAQVRPGDYPAAASALHLPDTRCVVRIAIDAAGRPTDVTPKACPEVFRRAAHDVGMRYRFHPLKDEAGRAIPAAFELAITFQASE